jgi:alpha-1,3/alpha-1,6-mannosyltransferase
VNSLFTRSKFKEAFEILGKSCVPSVLYPTIDESNDEARINKQFIAYGDKYSHIFVSLNRYERKKNIELALESLKFVKSKVATKSRILLVIAGGYDLRVAENVEYLEELCKKADSLGLTYVNTGLSTISELPHDCDVIFRCSISNQERQALLTYSTALIYTPSNEHFGIVPLEAMYCKTPVIAVNNGGPLETVIDNQTGFLCEANANDFGNALKKFIENSGLAEQYGANGKKHVERNFTNSIMKNHLKNYLDIGSSGGSKNDRGRVMLYAFSFYFMLIGCLCCYLYTLFTLF